MELVSVQTDGELDEVQIIGKHDELRAFALWFFEAFDKGETEFMVDDTKVTIVEEEE